MDVSTARALALLDSRPDTESPFLQWQWFCNACSEVSAGLFDSDDDAFSNFSTHCRNYHGCVSAGGVLYPADSFDASVLAS